jgi:hypothetical protein
VMFAQSGVIQADDDDLTISVPTPSEKKFLVKPGMAIGRVPDAAEAREIVLRDPTPLTDLMTQQTAFQSGDKAIVTARYHEKPVADPPSQSDVPNPTRILEQALIEVHRNTAPQTDTDNNPYVILGEIDVNSMTVTTAQRQVAVIRTALFATVPGIRVEPNQVTAGQNVSLSITSTGGFNLSAVTTNQVSLQPPTGITGIAVSNQQAARLTLSFRLDAATSGSVVVKITVNNVSTQDTLTVRPGLAVTGFKPVDVPNNNRMFKILGTGFSAPATVQFAKVGGGFADPIVVLQANLTPTELGIPLENIPATATKGPVQVQSNGQSVTSTAVVVPPAQIAAFNPPSVPRNTNVTITGNNFFATGLTIGFTGATRPPPALGGLAGESVSDTKIVVNVPGTASTGTITITTEGGTVVSSTPLGVQ